MTYILSRRPTTQSWYQPQRQRAVVTLQCTRSGLLQQYSGEGWGHSHSHSHSADWHQQQRPTGRVRTGETLFLAYIKFILRTPHHYTCCISHWSSHTTLIYVTCTCLSLSPPSLLLLLEDEHHGYHEAAAFTISDTNDPPHAVTFYATADNGVNSLEKSINAWNECKRACTYVCACIGESDNTPTHW